MKNSSKAALALSSLWLASASALAGGVEMAPPSMWDFYIGGSAVGYGYEHRISSAVINVNQSSIVPVDSLSDPVTRYRNIAVVGGFDVGIGVWADRGYFGIEGRYDIARLSAENMASDYGLPSTIGGFFNVYTIAYTAAMYNNASLLLKLGYQLFPRTMSYVVLGWARTTYSLSSRVFTNNLGTTVATTGTQGGAEIFASSIYKKSLNGGTVGFGFSHLLVDGLSAFAEFALNAYHIPSEVVVNSANPSVAVVSTTTTPPVAVRSLNILNFNYYNYNLRVGLNWSFASLI